MALAEIPSTIPSDDDIHSAMTLLVGSLYRSVPGNNSPRTLNLLSDMRVCVTKGIHMNSD